MKRKILYLIKMVSKNLFYGCIIQCLFMTTLLANDSKAQVKPIDETFLRMADKAWSLSDVFKNLESKTDYVFIFPDDLLVDRDPVVLKAGKQSVNDVLIQLAQASKLKFRQVNNAIYVGGSSSSAQQREISITIEFVEITGRIVDEQGQPVPGATVLIEGSSTGTVSDIDGNFSIEAAEGSVLLVSFIGYESQRITVGSQTNLNITLREDQSSLEEVVVVGYGTQKKRDITGSVASIGEEGFNPGVVTSVDQLIVGRAAGVQITQASAEPGGGVSIRIRGANSINANNEPLYVIDGLPIDNGASTPSSGVINNPTPRNPLNALNPSDIQSIEILKDASATAIYGSRGANGVILITTKKGQQGKMKVNYNGYYGTQEVANRIDMLDAQQYMSLLNDLRAENNQAPEFSQSEISEVGSGTDWQREIYRTASVQNHQLSFSGGNEETRYFASLNYFDQDGVVINSGIKRYTGRMNIEHLSGEKFIFGMNLNTSFIEDNFVPFGIGINENAGVINSSIYQDPTMPIFDANGNYFQSPIVNLENPVAFANDVYDMAETNRTFGNVYGQYNLNDEFSIKLNLGSDRQTSRRDNYVATSTRRGGFNGGIADVRSNERSNYLLELTTNYTKEINDHKINFLAGYTYQEFVGRFVRSSGQNFPSDAFLTNNLDAGSQGTFAIGTNKFRNQLLSYLGRANYSFADKYLMTVSFRADGSSRFGENNKFGYFPSVALGWRIIDEPFMSDQDFFSELKFRSSYGLTGNQEIGNYNSLILLGTQGQAQFDGNPFVGISTTQAQNPNLKWEVTKQLNLGLDFSFLSGRIDGAVDYFYKQTDDLLMFLPIPRTTGFNSSLQNVGSMENQGFEFTLSSKNIVGEFSWNTSLNFSVIRNKVLDISGLPFILQGGAGFTQNISIIQEGLPLNSYFGFVVDGIFQQNDDIENSPQPLAKPGELKYRDVNGDGQISPADRDILGSPFPDFTYGINNSFSFRNFDLSFFIQGVQGSQIFNFNRVESENPISFRRNRLAVSYTDRWTPENPTNENTNGQPVSVAYGGPVNSRAIEDASFVRLRNVQLNYRIPNLSSKYFSNASIYLSGQNLVTLTNYSGMDPEVSSFGTSNVRADYNAYPFTRMFTLGINLEL
ncbi:TonB-linked outer membrane protein, SusC/RagA family [Cyclobacterium xiamenense]|uniref:TonB-linked outer membrane protein, SusC/RagA family n=1 Tax=Cyclobacterium xiamenense TaxID=1297121 RepID=A0A1H6ZK48_9BACT|nr:TonB-dependent receptor [Cyclobacterium xiamenense]SEJ51917.1 TonB-linked outer membrane protein, SusC/RagA family [Cyclobacterium xiamenense]